MTRIVSGLFRGRQLKVPPTGTRPTSERVREALFSRLETWDEISEAKVLDLFAGSGALGIEAVSRGAASAVLVDFAASAVNACKANTVVLASDKFQVMRADAIKYANSPGTDEFSLVFIDPPYDFPAESLTQILEGLRNKLLPNALVVVEASKRTVEPSWPVGYEVESYRDWGETRVWFVTFLKEDNDD